MAALAMALAASSARLMASPQAVAFDHRVHQGVDRMSSASANCRSRSRLGRVSTKPMLWKAAAPRSLERRSSAIVAAVGGEFAGEDGETKGIEIGGEKEPEIAGVLDSSEEEATVLLEPPVNSIDEGYVEALNDGTLDGVLSEEKNEDGEDLEDLKQQLVDTLYGTQRGLRASSDSRAEIVELISQLEAKNPTPAPTEALNLLDGKWILAYTSSSELSPLLAAGNLPLVTIGEISQTINSQSLTVENTVSFEGPLTSTSFSACASFEIRSPKRVQVKFEEGVIGAPKLTDSVEVPLSVDVFGQNIDLTAAQGLLKPLQDVAASVARMLSGQPPLKFPIQNDRAQSWLLTTFLDEDLRISSGDSGSLFVLLREGSTLLY